MYIFFDFPRGFLKPKEKLPFIFKLFLKIICFVNINNVYIF
jgi:hypothetical protein